MLKKLKKRGTRMEIDNSGYNLAGFKLLKVKYSQNLEE